MGSIDALVALAIVIPFKASGVLIFSQGEVAYGALWAEVKHFAEFLRVQGVGAVTS